MSYKIEDEDDSFENWLKFQWWLTYHNGSTLSLDVFDKYEKQFREIQRWTNYIFIDVPTDARLPLPEEDKPYPTGCACLFHNSQKDTSHLDRFLDAQGILDSSHQTPEFIDPSIDIIEWDKTVSITTEIHECSEKDIDLEITENKVIIRVDAKEGKYCNEVELPCDIDVDSAIISYHNGILDIELKKVIVDRGEGIKAN
jgi:HSP20 family molecular chaperone IbpA